MKGYAHPDYADSLAEFGSPREMPQCGGWILERPIPGFPYRDAMGCYPLFICRDWSQLHSDLKALQGDFVSLSLVTDPFGNYDLDLLHECFDLVIPFKEHFITDLNESLNLSRRCRRYTKKAFENVTVELYVDPASFVEEWTELYETLVTRCDLKGIRAFSRTAFAKQLSLPGAVMFRAFHQGTTVGAHLWYLHDEVAYGHLAPINSLGRQLMASYSLYSTAIDFFTGKAHWLDWGAGVGVKNENEDSLSQFKRGWSTGTRTAYFCGRIFDRERYDEILNASGVTATDYFPAYRRGEFG